MKIMDITAKITEMIDTTVNYVIMELYDSGKSFPEIALYTGKDIDEVETIVCAEIAKNISEIF